MTISKSILSGIAAAGLIATAAMPASAADVTPAYKVLSPARASTWTGFYAGVNGGYAFGTADISAFTPPTTLSMSSSYDGFVGGAQLGYNWQTGSLVFGVEAELNYADVSGSRLMPGTTIIVNDTLEWFGTARGRIGYAFDRMMPYVTGGFAFGKNKLEARSAVAGVLATDFATHRGWTIGGGVEFAVAGKWSAKIEYLHVDLGSRNSYLADAIAGAGSYMKPDLRFGLARMGVNYRF